MIAGVATYVLAFAWVTAVPWYRARIDPGNFGWALRVAANTRAALAPAMFFGPDLWLGAASVWIVQWLTGAGSKTVDYGPTLPMGSPLPIYAITVVQGALVSATMGVLALAIWGIRCGWKSFAARR